MIEIGIYVAGDKEGYLKWASNITAETLAEKCLDLLESEGIKRDSWEWFSPGYEASGAKFGEIPKGVRQISVWAREGGSEGYILEIGGITKDSQYLSLVSGKTFVGLDFVSNCAAILTKSITL